MIKGILIVSLILVLTLAPFVFADSESLHPSNKMLMTLYPRPFGFRFPSVPRIHAADGLVRYKNGEATVIWTGVGGGLVPGGLHLGENLLCRLVDEKKLEYLKKKKMVILY